VIDQLLHLLSPNQAPNKQEALFVKVNVLLDTNPAGIIAVMACLI
jgi:hypothetical protein